MGTKKPTATKKAGATKKQPTGKKTAAKKSAAKKSAPKKAAAKKPAPKKPPAKKLTDGAKSFTVAAVESALGIELTARYRHFLESGEYRKHNHRFVSGVPGLAGKREVVFDAPKLLSMWKTHGVKTSSIIPLAAFAGESELLTIDLRDSAVGVWDEGAFLKFLPSLDALLACLLGKGEKTIREKLSEAIDQATPLNKADKDAAAVKILDAAIGDLTAATVPDDARRELAKAFNLRGSSLMGLDREADGLASWEESARCGTRSGHQAILMICENHLDNKQAAKAVEWGERLFALDELKDTHAFFWGKLYLGLGKLLGGDEPGARELLEMIATKFANDVDRRAKAHDAVTTYAPGSPMASLFG